MGTSIWDAKRPRSLPWLSLSLAGKTSAMATSLIGPFLIASAFSIAPVPRPPHPTRASWIVLFSAACTWGRVIPARVETPAMRPASPRKARRDVVSLGSIIVRSLRRYITLFHRRVVRSARSLTGWRTGCNQGGRGRHAHGRNRPGHGRNPTANWGKGGSGDPPQAWTPAPRAAGHLYAPALSVKKILAKRTRFPSKWSDIFFKSQALACSRKQFPFPRRIKNRPPLMGGGHALDAA